HRVMLGHRELRDEADQLGFLALLESRRREPEAPQGITVNPPRAAALRNRLFSRVRWADPVVRTELERQNAWYAWRGRRSWHAAWADQTSRWERKAAELRRELQATIDAFGEHVRPEEGRVGPRAQELYPAP